MMKQRTLRPLIRAAALGALTPLAAMAATVSAAHAQDATLGGLDIPDNPTLMGENPDLRLASAKVGGAVITGTDIDRRLALELLGREGEVPPEEMAQVRVAIRNRLIDEWIQIQKAVEDDMAVEDAQVIQMFNRAAQQNFGQKPEEMDAFLRQYGTTAETLLFKIRAELAWQRLQSRYVAPFVNVSEEEVREIIARQEAAKGQEEFFYGEIALSSTPETRDQVYQTAMQIVEAIKQGADFRAIAARRSQISTAAKGGDSGWLRADRLDPAIAETVRSMQVGQLVGPVEMPGGFSIILLRDKRRVLTTDPRDAVLSLAQISAPIPPGLNEETFPAFQERYVGAIRSIRGCGDLDRGASEYGLTVVRNQEVPARNLPGQLQGELLSLSLGQTTRPFPAGDSSISVLMLCGRDDPQVAASPDFEQVLTSLEDERIGKRAQAFLRDLRRDAIVTYGSSTDVTGG
ncbi:peptidylprolyl isomerase [Pseudoblastomonas halimionae]|uniref:Parvulin-like PPIase n=1 Tax=Alteriqipengyuania halimionae TaxID=1926630 RepID=A0A6I4U4T4_9SPHN|nr:peptidylprolyl isomerase [Alteriqipengyuania halimionae]MXP09923.1 peptidylprolyl isomerase [Alteriqipengyuania halimionae]